MVVGERFKVERKGSETRARPWLGLDWQVAGGERAGKLRGPSSALLAQSAASGSAFAVGKRDRELEPP